MSLDLESPSADAGAHAGRAHAMASAGKVRGQIELHHEFEGEGEAEGPEAGAEANFSGGDYPQGSASAKAVAGRVCVTFAEDSLIGYKTEIQGPNAEARAGFDRSYLEARASAKCGVGKIEGKYLRGIVKIETRGPNAGVRAGVGVRENGAMAKAELVRTTVQAGPVVFSAGLGVSTGARIGGEGFEGKILGTGIKCIQEEDGEFEFTVSLFGSKVGCKTQ